MAGTLNKQPSESRLYDMDFSPKMTPAELIASVVSVTELTVNEDETETASSDLTISGEVYSGQVAQARIAAGLDGVLYKVTFIVTTDLSNTLEAEGYLMVENL